MRSPVRLSVFVLALAAGLAGSARTHANPILDPAGDTFVPGPTIDIVASQGFAPGNPGQFRLSVNFATPISPASAFAPNSVIGYVDIDTDQNAATGASPFINTFGGPPPVIMGNEFYIDLASELFNPGFVDLYDANTNTVLGSLAITYGPSSFFIDLPLSLIGGDQQFNYALIVGDFLSPTDRAPNGALPLAIPEPASIAVFGLMLTGVAGVIARRRRVAAA
jgi:hypothetical protein